MTTEAGPFYGPQALPIKPPTSSVKTLMG